MYIDYKLYSFSAIKRLLSPCWCCLKAKLGAANTHCTLRLLSPYVTSSLLSRFHLAPRMCLLLVYRSVRSFKYLLPCTVSPRSDGKR